MKSIRTEKFIHCRWCARSLLIFQAGMNATIAFIRSLVAEKEPATPAARGIDVYNSETVATREGLSYDHIYREYIETRKVLLELIRTMPEEKVTQIFTLPWGGEGTLVDMVDIFEPHEEEHAEDVRKIIEEHK